jgi:hypothetical protein
MHRTILLLFVIVSALSTSAQTAPPGTISQPPAPPVSGTNELGPNNLSFTNHSGTSYSVEQLAGQLQNLRTSVEQTLPMLSAFNETFSNSVSHGGSSVVGAISGILSGALDRKTANNTSGHSTTNLLTVLQRLLTTNGPASTTINPNRVQDLNNLQKDLQPVASVLQSLNVAGSSGNRPSAEPGSAPGGLTPTGR